MPSIALSRAIHCDMIAATYDWVKRIACDHSGTLIFFDWLLAFLWLCTMFFNDYLNYLCMSSDVESTLHKPNVPCGSNTPVLTDAAGAFGEPKWVPKSDRCLHLTNEGTIV
jgi:hypothetical protein